MIRELHESGVTVCLIFVPPSGMARGFHFTWPRALSWAQVFREDSLRPLVISDMGSRPQTVGSLPRVFRLCIRHFFIHYSAHIYCAPSLCQARCQVLSKRVLNKGRMVKAVQPFPGVVQGPGQPCSSHPHSPKRAHSSAHGPADSTPDVSGFHASSSLL